LGPLVSTSAAQTEGETDAEVDSGTAVITVVVAGPGDIVIGATSTPSRPWPYTCEWYTLRGGSGGEDFQTTRPEGGGRHRLVCEPRPGFDVEPIDVITNYNPAEPIPGVAVVTSAQLAIEARDALRPEPLYVGLSPEDVQITGVETWFWPDGTIAEQTETASAGGLTATVRAKWVSTTFYTGEDGVEVTCTAQTIWTPGATSSPCTHTYLTESPARTVRAVSQWSFTWWDNAGQQTPVSLGTEPYEEVEVIEVVDLEAVISSGRR